jgi:hypothetical protein
MPTRPGDRAMLRQKVLLTLCLRCFSAFTARRSAPLCSFTGRSHDTWIAEALARTRRTSRAEAGTLPAPRRIRRQRKSLLNGELRYRLSDRTACRLCTWESAPPRLPSLSTSPQRWPRARHANPITRAHSVTMSRPARGCRCFGRLQSSGAHGSGFRLPGDSHQRPHLHNGRGQRKTPPGVPRRGWLALCGSGPTIRSWR